MHSTIQLRDCLAEEPYDFRGYFLCTRAVLYYYLVLVSLIALGFLAISCQCNEMQYARSIFCTCTQDMLPLSSRIEKKE